MTARTAEQGSREGGLGQGDATQDERSERLCVGCRRTSAPGELLRLAIGHEEPWLVPDPRRRLGGRGVSVHPARACIELAVRRGGFARSLPHAVSIDVEALCQRAAALYLQRSESLLVAAARRKSLALGTEAVRDAIREARLTLLVVAADAENRRDELAAAVARLHGRCVVMGTKSALGHLFGRDEVAVLGVLDPRIADELVRCAAFEAELMGRTLNSALLSEAE